MRKTGEVALDQVDSLFDVQVDPKMDRIVMVYANAKGRKAVEELWPDVEWVTDEIFLRLHSPDWLFTHVRVTKLQPHLEAKIPLAFASSESLGFAVALALRSVADRVAWFSGQGRDVRINTFGEYAPVHAARSMFVEYVPAGTWVATSPQATGTVQ